MTYYGGHVYHTQIIVERLFPYGDTIPPTAYDVEFDGVVRLREIFRVLIADGKRARDALRPVRFQLAVGGADFAAQIAG